MNLTLREIADAVSADLSAEHDALRARGVSIDSRRVEAGQLFVAIAGERFDGHRFAAQALEAGAAAVLVSRQREVELPEGGVALRVDDTRVALGRLARAWRERVAPTVIAVTGSMGKTTTKELLAGILEATGAPTHATRGNFNNDIGLPLTLLAMAEGTRYLVTEMGMNAPGEIAALCRIARPDVGLITNIAPVHLEGLGSIEAIAAAKAELLYGLGERGVAVIPDDEPLLAPHVAHLKAARAVTFGERARGGGVRVASVSARGAEGSDVTLALGESGETISLRLPLVGRHNARNAAAAAAAALALDIAPEAIARGLARPPELSHRSVIRVLGEWRVLDDCYNASPRAVEAALAALVDLAAADDTPAVAVLG
ncbi:MAG: UDP-N-acetylmuramoyl-tripeptide--D-alanyl-D-alanine ligase, partial [Myxococcales bacterium]|nr:UDP-N-acetylmuramoyl-tripeptide--D-alanyl-D-alanine ligase [Myxococcales bacterium]